ncbi:MAG: LacI family transcriptional regulator, partial [Spirochaetia bacterium]|nr:LacI family transcriptional regulator [Spirochaetia bacterium]
IVLDQRMIKAGTFVDEAGKQMVNYLLDGGFAFDALICLNDWMALGALNELSKRGIKVPDDVSVVGFDGMESSRYTLPPLTTVVQPLYEMGKIAVDILDRIMAGGDQEHIVLPSSPVIRESCGCNPHVSYTPGLYEMPPYASVSERLAVQDLLQLVRNGDYHQMISRLNRAIDTTAKESGALHHWNEYLSVVEYKSRVESNLSSKTLTMLSGAARTLIGDKIGRYQAAKRLEVENSFNCLRTVSENLNGSFELQQLITNLKESLRLFGLERGYLVGFEKTTEKARLMMTLHEEILPLEAYQKTFSSQDLLPPILTKQWKKERWVLLPLVYLHESLGYLLVPFGIVMPALYDILQEQVSSNLKGSLLLDQVRKSEK